MKGKLGWGVGSVGKIFHENESLSLSTSKLALMERDRLRELLDLTVYPLYLIQSRSLVANTIVGKYIQWKENA